MSGTVMSPTPEIETAGMLLEEAIGRLIKAMSDSPISDEYESSVESHNLLWLTIRHVESVVALASRDLVLLPSAMAVTRVAFETALKMRWMMVPDDPFDREVRWLVHLKSEEKYYNNIASQLADLGADEDWRQGAERTREFRIGVTNKLPDGYVPLKDLPNVYDMLNSLEEERWYVAYRVLCQYAHGTHYASGLYRKGLGTAKVLGEYITPADWWVCFALSWYSLHRSGRRFLEIAGGDVADFLSADYVHRLQDTINAIRR